jgi:putative endonuclease
MRTERRRELGQAGEALAANLLTARGLRILDRNWRDGRRGELDIVAFDVATGQVVVVEVRTRTGDRYGSALESVGPAKLARVRRLAAAWLAAHDVHGNVRFDVVAVTVPWRGGAAPASGDALAQATIDWVRGVAP